MKINCVVYMIQRKLNSQENSNIHKNPHTIRLANMLQNTIHLVVHHSWMQTYPRRHSSQASTNNQQPNTQSNKHSTSIHHLSSECVRTFAHIAHSFSYATICFPSPIRTRRSQELHAAAQHIFTARTQRSAHLDNT